MTLALEQLLNGVQFGIMLFLMAAGLTLIFGIMNVINLAHGSLYMIGAYGAALVAAQTGSFLLAVPAGLLAAAVAGLIIEFVGIRKLYDRDHLQQVLATFGLFLFINEGTTMLFGRTPLFVGMPSFLSGSVEIIPGIPYPTYRIAIMVVGLLVALGLYLLVNKTRIGMLVRAGSTHREMVRALGVDIRLLYTVVFGLGALLAGLAGLMAGPLLAVQVGMGEQILILTFVVVVIGLFGLAGEERRVVVADHAGAGARGRHQVVHLGEGPQHGARDAASVAAVAPWCRLPSARRRASAPAPPRSPC